MKRKIQFIFAFIAITLYSTTNAQVYVNENFDSTIPGTWAITDGGTATGDSWASGMIGGSSSLDGTNGAFVDSDNAGSGVHMIETLETPVMNTSGATLVYLEFDQYYYNYTSDSAVVEVFDGTNWIVLLNQHASAGAFNAPDHQMIDITAYANANMKVRFVYDDDNVWAWYWMIDNVKVYQPTPNDLSVTEVTTTADGSCTATSSESVSIKIKNVGTASQSNFGVGYNVNGNVAATETVSSTIAPGDSLVYTFTTTYDLSADGSYIIDGYTSLTNDGDNTNDLATTTYSHQAGNFTGNLFVTDTSSTGTFAPTCPVNTSYNTIGSCYALSAVVIDSLTHTYCGDLTITLISPNGDSLVLSDQNGGSGNDYLNIVFTDTALTYISSVSTGGFAAGGYYHTQDSVGLAKFNGTNPNGIWTLWIVDNASGDDGYIDNWHLEFKDNCVSVAENDNSTNFNVYPTPNNGQFTIENTDVNGKVNIEIYDVSGKLVLSKTNYASGYLIETINVNVVSGIYFVKLQSEKGSGVKQIIIE